MLFFPGERCLLLFNMVHYIRECPQPEFEMNNKKSFHEYLPSTTRVLILSDLFNKDIKNFWSPGVHHSHDSFTDPEDTRYPWSGSRLSGMSCQNNQIEFVVSLNLLRRSWSRSGIPKEPRPRVPEILVVPSPGSGSHFSTMPHITTWYSFLNKYEFVL